MACLKKEQYQKWNTEKIINELKIFAKELRRTPTTFDFKEKNNYALYKASIRYFGSYTNALKEAELKPNITYWSKEKILIQFKQIATELQRVPTYRDLVKIKRHDMLDAIRRYFNSQHNVVVKECGFQPNNIKWNKNRIKEELVSLSEINKKTPTEREIRQKNSGLFGATIRYFNSLNKAIEYSGLKVNHSFVEDDLWKYWENFVIRALQAIYGAVEVHPRLPNKTIPDARIGTKIIEVKLNVAHEYVIKDIKNYSPYSEKIEIWYMYGKPTILDNKVEYFNPEKIESLLRLNKQNDLVDQLYRLKKGIKC